MPEAAVLEEPKQKHPQEHFRDLRQWIKERCGAGHDIRQSAYLMALSANVHRLIKYGPDQTLNHLTCRDLLNLLFFANGEMAEWIMRTAFTRALIEDDREVFEHLAQCIFMPEVRAWYWKLVQGILGKAENPAEMTTWFEQMPPEEKSLARLMVARCFPDTACMQWVAEAEGFPEICYQLAEIVNTKESAAWVSFRPVIRLQAFR